VEWSAAADLSGGGGARRGSERVAAANLRGDGGVRQGCERGAAAATSEGGGAGRGVWGVIGLGFFIGPAGVNGPRLEIWAARLAFPECRCA
jgi:hypothetical protein